MEVRLLQEVQVVLREAGRSDLADRLQSEISAKPLLTSTEAAAVLGVSSSNTVKNWLEGGMFPGAFRTPGGHWRFPREEVESVARLQLERQARNQSGDISPNDEDSDVEPPLL